MPTIDYFLLNSGHTTVNKTEKSLAKLTRKKDRKDNLPILGSKLFLRVKNWSQRTTSFGYEGKVCFFHAQLNHTDNELY